MTTRKQWVVVDLVASGESRSDKESELQIIADCERNVESDDWSITVTNTVTNTNLFASYSYFHCSTTE